MKRLLLLAVFLVLAVPASAARLPILAPHDWWPVYSPDSRYVAFTEVNGQGRIFTLKVVDTETKRVRTLAQSQTQPLPSWSADSKTIAYQSLGRIRSIGVDGSNRRDLYPGIYPAWSPKGMRLAYRNNLALYVDGVKVAGNGVIGMPAWSPDGTTLAFTRSDGIYLLAGGLEQKVTIPPSDVWRVLWSPDGKLLAYESEGYVYVVAPQEGATPRRAAGFFYGIGPLAWGPTSDVLAYTVRGGVELSTNEPTWHSQLIAKSNGIGTSFAPASPHSDLLAYSGPNLQCPGPDAIKLYESRQLAGSCAIAGTAAADTILGTGSGGDRIAAGAGNDMVRARNGRRDVVSCGPGRDTVWADRGDRLSSCEIVRR